MRSLGVLIPYCIALDIDGGIFSLRESAPQAGDTLFDQNRPQRCPGGVGQAAEDHSLARPGPTMRGDSFPAFRRQRAARREFGRPIVAVVGDYADVAPSAISHPPPIAAPLIAAITGTRYSSCALNRSRRAKTNLPPPWRSPAGSSLSAGALREIARRHRRRVLSACAVTITTRNSGSFSTSSHPFTHPVSAES